MHFRIASAALALMSSAAAIPASAAVLQPTENWDVDYGLTQCTAARSFGDASAPVVFGIVPSLSGDSYKLLVSVPRAGPVFAEESKGTVDFGRGGISSGTLHYGAKGVALSVYQFRIPAAYLSEAGSAATVSLRSADGANFTFALSDMPALIGGLRNCTADLQHYWNMRAGRAMTAAKAAADDVRTLFTRADYPVEALRREQEGRDRAIPARYQLLIDERGAVAGCDVLSSSGAPALDSTFCEVMGERAKFTPARDSRGTPVRSVVTTPVVSWSDHNAFNSSCMWVSDDEPFMINECGMREPVHAIHPFVAPPPPPPPPPSKS
jgi:hypothetical protein